MGRCSYTVFIARLAIVTIVVAAVRPAGAQGVQWETDPPTDSESDRSDVSELPESQQLSDDEARFLLHNTVLGPTGGVHVVDAGAAPHRTFRLALMTEFFVLRDFIEDDDDARFFAGTLSFSWTAHPNLEVFAALRSQASDNSKGNPTLIHQLGNIHGGLKFFAPAKPYLTLGGDVSFVVPGSVGDAGVGFKGISAGLRGNLTADFRRLPRRVPLIGRFNAQYWMDNTDRLIKDTEDRRYDALMNPASRAQETRHRLSAIERFGLGINRTDAVRLGVGLESPLRVGDKFRIHPLAEWMLDIPVNRQGFSCVVVVDASNRPIPGQDSCLKEEGFKAFPMSVTLGAKLYPPVRGLGLTVAADIRITGKDDFTHERSPNAPYTVFVGLSYAYEPRRYEASLSASPELIEPGLIEPAELTDIEPEQPEIGAVEAAPEVLAVEPVLSPPSNLDVTTTDKDGAPIGGVKISLSGPSDQELTTDGQGHYKVESLAAGQYKLRAEAAGYYVLSKPLQVQESKAVIATVRLTKRSERSRVSIGRRHLAIRGQIMFSPGSDQIAEKSEMLLFELTETLAKHTDLKLVEVQGHTDNRGGTNANMDLSQRRADAVVLWLAEQGISHARLTARGYGDSRPVLPNITAQNRARNRRVEFIVHRRSDSPQ